MRYITLFFTCLASLVSAHAKPDISIPALEESSTYTLVAAGVANEVYIVTDSSKTCVLKIFNRKTLDELENSEALLQLVRNAGINVPQSLIPPSKVESKVISVLAFVKGEHINESHLPDTAKLMAKLHLIESPQKAIIGSKDYYKLFDSCKDWKYCEELKKVFESLDLSYMNLLPRGLIHGDFSYTNLIVDQNGILTLLDFDHLRQDILLTDLVRCHLFYGFDKEGSLKEGTIQAFVSAYNSVRPLKAAELDAFYTHLKLCLLDVALEMYDHMYVKKDLPIGRVDGTPVNACLNPDRIAKEILSIKDRRSLVLENPKFPIFFFGLSGVGKTTLIHLLEESSDLFYIPKFTVTRPLREDDDSRYFEYLSVDEFIKGKDQGKFFVWMDQKGVYYGYRFEHLTDPNRYPLLNASAYGIEMVKLQKGIKVLIEGDSQQGLLLRNNPEVAKTREKVNQLAQEKFFGQEAFRKEMNLIFSNQFGNPADSSRELKREILQGIDYAN